MICRQNRAASRLGILHNRKSMDFEEWIAALKAKQDYAGEQERKPGYHQSFIYRCK